LDHGADAGSRIGQDPGSAIIRAFEAGYRLVQDVDFDFVVKLDCDLDFAPDYFQRLIDKFHRDLR